MRVKLLLASILLLMLSSNCSEMSQSEENSDRNFISQKKPIPDNSITNLYDAFGKEIEGLVKDFGFSALIKFRGKLILFDAGTNADILKNNVEALGIDLSLVDIAIASHVHGDHINGFDYLLSINPDVKLYFPSDFFGGAPIHFNVDGEEKEVIDSLPEHMRYFDGEKQDFEIVQSGRFWKANVQFLKENTEIAPGINLIFTRSPFLGYCSRYPSAIEISAMSDGNEQIDKYQTKYGGMPELSLSLHTNNGEILIVGCSHSSVQNIVLETKQVRNEEISLLMGGYHMLPYGREELRRVTHQLKNEFNVNKVAPAHCTGHLAFKLLQDVYGQDYIYAGLGETIQFE